MYFSSKEKDSDVSMYNSNELHFSTTTKSYHFEVACYLDCFLANSDHSKDSSLKVNLRETHTFGLITFKVYVNLRFIFRKSDWNLAVEMW